MKNDYFIENIFSKFIEIKGVDSSNFLQGLITNDINKCSKENTIYSCLLTPQGKFLADFFISKIEDTYLIEINKKYYDQFLDRLDLYKLRSDVQFKNIKNLKSIIVFNNKIITKIDKLIEFLDPRHKDIGRKIYLKDDSIIPPYLKKESYNFYKKILMKNLIPNTSDDLIVNKSLLLENNFQNINSIDWNKGCYIGQEITARMKYRSLLKKQIYVLELLSGEINVGDNILENDIIIGNVISKVENYILCMLKIDHVKNKILNKEKMKLNSTTLLQFL